jgi:hypothetical protein
VPHVRDVSETLSIRQPVPATDSSLPIRQRSTMLCPAAADGRLTVVVTKPPEEPLQASLPASGLEKVVLIVAL